MAAFFSCRKFHGGLPLPSSKRRGRSETPRRPVPFLRNGERGAKEKKKKMEIKSLLENGGAHLLIVSPADLKEFALCVADDVRRDVKKEMEEDTGAMLTPKEAAKKLGVTLTTLWRWQRTHYLDAVKIGGKTRYKEVDIKKLLGQKVGGDVR